MPPYSDDANTASFSQTELEKIVAIWRGVSEDYSMFNVDVTTVDQIAKGTPQQNFTRVCIGGTSETVLGVGAGGIAYVGVFGYASTTYQPAFVFPGNLGNGFPK